MNSARRCRLNQLTLIFRSFQEARVLRIVLTKLAAALFDVTPDRFLRLLLETVAHRGAGERVVDLGIELRAYIVGRSRRHEHANPLLAAVASEISSDA